MRKLVGIVLLALGVLALVYGGFTYVEDRHQVGIGPLQVEVKERERVEVPVWVGVLLVAAGGAVLILGRR